MRQLLLKETVASVALSHDADCDCTTCRAAKGDEAAMAEVMLRFAELDARDRKGET